MTRTDQLRSRVRAKDSCTVLKTSTKGDRLAEFNYTERYMGLPEEQPRAYQDANLLTYADKLKRPLLLVHGTADDNVFFRHTLKLSNALFRAGKEFDLLPLPGLTHMVPDPVVTERLWTRVAGHFRKHLGAPK